MNPPRVESIREPDAPAQDPLDRGGALPDPFDDHSDGLVPYLDVALEGQLSGLQQAIERADKVVLLQGPEGIGKSTLLISLLDRVQDPTRICAFAARKGTTPQAIENTLRQTWASSMGLRENAPASAILNALCLRGLHPVILVDDAHWLPPQALAELLRLRHEARRACPTNPGLLLAGEGDLQGLVDALADSAAPATDWLRVVVQPLTAEQTEAYLAHRLTEGGQPGAIPAFRKLAAAIHRESGGIPAQINALARARNPSSAIRPTEASPLRGGALLQGLPKLNLRFQPSLLYILAGAAALTGLLVTAALLLFPGTQDAPDPAGNPMVMPEAPDPTVSGSRPDPAPTGSPPLPGRDSPSAESGATNSLSGPSAATALRPGQAPDPAAGGGSATVADSEATQAALEEARSVIEQLRTEREELRAALTDQSVMLDPIRRIADDRERLAAAIDAEFGDDWGEWNAEFDPGRLTIEFRAPDALWRAGELSLQPRYRDLMNEFLGRLVPLLDPFRERIREIRLEGHTSSGWRGTDDATVAFFNNLRLSQDRIRTLLIDWYEQPALAGEQAWVRNRLTAIGLSSAYPILDADGQEDGPRSRRISVRIVLETDPALEAISRPDR